MAQEKRHSFWNTQPVKIREPGRKEPSMSIPEGYQMRTVNIEEEISQVQYLLSNHYVEDCDSMFKLEYSKEFLIWQLKSPDTLPEWNIGLYMDEEIIGFISAQKIQIRIKEEAPPTVIVNFLCLHKNHRNNRLAPMLITEIRKRANKHEIYKALFTSGTDLSFGFSSTRYYHRIIRKDALVEKGFCLRKDVEKSLVSLESKRDLHRKLRKATEEDLSTLYKLYRKKYGKIDLEAVLTLEQFRYYIMPRDGLVECFISEDNQEFFSLYSINTKVISDGSFIKTVYLYYHATDREDAFDDLSLYIKRETDYSVFNILCVGNITQGQLEKYGFLQGDGLLKYYLFNWNVGKMQPENIGFVPF